MDVPRNLVDEVHDISLGHSVFDDHQLVLSCNFSAFGLHLLPCFNNMPGCIFSVVPAADDIETLNFVAFEIEHQNHIEAFH